MLILSLVAALLQLALACLCYKVSGRGGRAVAFVVFGALVFLSGGCIMSVPLFFNGLLLAFVGLAACVGDARFRTFVGCGSAGTVLVFLIAIALVVPAYRQRLKAREQLRLQFPFESLSARLSYERERTSRKFAQSPPTADSAGQSLAVAEPTQEESLSRLERILDPNDFDERFRGRSEALRLIHTTKVQQFIDSPGFGVVRMVRMGNPERWAALPDVRPTRLPPREFVDFDATPTGGDAESKNLRTAEPVVDAPEPRQLRVLHEEELLDFVNYKGWGYVEDINRVAGFQVHHFRRTPTLKASKELESDSGFADFHDRDRGVRFGREPHADENWSVRKLELVSLLTHDEPCVYVSDELPRMDRAAEYPVRPLNTFERRALERLDAGEDLVSEPSMNRLIMLGALRASKPCMKCHQVDRGDLLGAFSYVLERTRPVREPQKSTEPAF